MNNLARSLLGGVALGALAIAPAMASDSPAFHLFAMHDGRLVSKTIMHHSHRQHISTVISTYSYIQPSDLHKTVKLRHTYFKWSDNHDICSTPKQWVKLSTKRTQYAKIGISTETYSEGCPNGPTTFYGDTYKLTNPAGEGQRDSFYSSLIGRFTFDGNKYRGDLILDVTVVISQ